MLSTTEECVLRTFREYHMTPNKMLCFYGQDLLGKEEALNSLIRRDLLVREKFAGGYSLTRAGYREMRRSD
ncbi:hypothetical protein NG895_20095 [Aeoliella sp. ICT_H6.2]|uniref:Uncharacterized protein n=1 Tax=Aeoliella straminimaris TaxID=2954799 RepID=A0A9X2FC43_9BACT|nr:hypothetical protein [Aeoliella straminimaris]MCO6046205.1 hypothetical protein [Aeoliella straminimaris]